MKPTLGSVALFVTFLFAQSLYAQWIPTGGPGGGEAYCFAQLGTRLFLGSRYGGVFVSDDGGISWEEANSGLPSVRVYSICALPGVALAGTREGIFVSSDSAASWHRFDEGVKGKLAFSLGSQGRYSYAGVNGEGLYRRAVGDTSWIQLNSDFVTKTVWCVKSIADKLYAGPDDGLYFSSDSGASWTKFPGFPSAPVYDIVADGSVLFAATGSSNGVLRSTNGGFTWVPSNAGMPIGDVVSLLVDTQPGDTTNIFAAFERHGLYVSTDHGLNWTPSPTGAAGMVVWQIMQCTAGLLIGTGGGGVYRSTDRGESWHRSNSGLGIALVTSLEVVENKLFATTDGAGPYVARDHGLSWESILDSLAEPMAMSSYFGNGTLLVGARVGLQQGAVYRSTDSAESWERLGDIPAQGGVDAITMNGPVILLGLTTGNGVYVSSNGGTSWQAKGLTGGNMADLLAFKSEVYAVGGVPGIMVSTNNGNSWVTNGLEYVTVHRLFDYHDTLFAGTNNGVYWAPQGNGDWHGTASTLGKVVQGFASSGSFLFASGNEGILRSADGGKTWSSINEGIDGIEIRCIAADDAFLYAGTSGKGLCRRPLSEILVGIENEPTTVPASITLFQNYPNPFNPSTTIRYGLPARSHVTLAVFNTLGQEVVILQNGDKEAGYHEVKVDASGLPSGVYFYCLQMGNSVQTRRLCVVR